MASHEYFERNTDGHPWSYQQRRGFDDAYEGHGYHPPRYGPDEKLEKEHEEYDLGFENGGYMVLEDAYPGISEATAQMHTSGKSSQEEIIHWLFMGAGQKRRFDREGHLCGYELDGRTIYG